MRDWSITRLEKLRGWSRDLEKVRGWLRRAEKMRDCLGGSRICAIGWVGGRRDVIV